MVHFRTGTNTIPSMEYTGWTKEAAFRGIKIKINDYLKIHPEELDKRWKFLGKYTGKDYCSVKMR